MRLLLVEDDDEDVEILLGLMAQTGLSQEKVRRVASLQAALQALTEAHYDVALVDLSLPDTQEMGALQHILAQVPSLPVVVLTGDNRFAAQSLRAGAQDYIAKHELTSSLLERTLRYSCDRKRHENEIIELKQRLESLTAKLATLAMTDPLTDLGNRRSFDQALDLEWRRARRHGGQVGVMLIDLDEFKSINDSFGHDTGDRVLMAAARSLTAATRRAGERAFRIGGDEFAVVVTIDTKADMQALAERIVRAYSREAPLPNLVMSLGSAILANEDADGKRRVLRAADRALYRAKSQGGGHVADHDLRADAD